MGTIQDFLLNSTAAQSNLWIQLVNNATNVAYVSTAATGINGAFTVQSVPAGTYTLNTGLTNTGPWSTVVSAYTVADRTPWFDVMDYGAVGNGVADDTSAIQSALNAAKGVGQVYFPPGSYKVQWGQIDLTSAGNKDLTVRGSGIGLTRILGVTGAAQTNPFPLIKVSATSNAGQITLYDLTLTNFAGVPAQRLANYCGLLFAGVQNVVNIERVEIISMPDDGVVHQGNSANVTLHGCNIRQNIFGWGINGTGSLGALQNLVVEDCSIWGNDGGIRIASSIGNTLRDNDIEGSGASPPAKNMIRIEGNNVWMSGNTCGQVPGGTAGECVYISGSANTWIGGDANVNTASKTCIHLTGTANSNHIISPALSGGGFASTIGILIDSGAADNIIETPTYSQLTTKITDNGTRTSLLNAGSSFYFTPNGILGNANATQSVLSADLVDMDIRAHVGNAIWMRDGNATNIARFNVANGLNIYVGGATIGAGDLAITAGKVTMGGATSQLVPGATSFSIRNNANNADNLLIADIGNVTARGFLSSSQYVYAGPNTGAGRIVGGTASLAFRNNADSTDNLIITDAGVSTFRNTIITNVQFFLTPSNSGNNDIQLGNASGTLRVLNSLGTSVLLSIPQSGAIITANGLTLTTGDLTITAGKIAMSTAASQLVPGATSFSVRDTANGNDNLLVTNTGNVTARGYLNSSLGYVYVGSFLLSTGRIVGGSSTLSMRNNADNADNVLISDTGTVTFRGGFQIDAAGHLISTASGTPTTTNLGTNVTSATFTGNDTRGTVAIVMSAGLAANTRVFTATFATTYGATAPKITLVDQTSTAGLAIVNSYVQAQSTGVSFDLAFDQALVAGTYTIDYIVIG